MSTVRQAFADTVTAALPAAARLYRTIVTGTPPTQYVVMYASPVDRLIGDAAQGFRDGMFRFYLTFVATTTDDLDDICQGLAERIIDALVGVRLTADGWLCGPIETDYMHPPQHDETVVQTPTVYVTAGFKLLADRLTVPV